MMPTHFPLLYVLALARVASFVVFLPIESRGMGPNAVRIALALVLTAVVAPFQRMPVPAGLDASPQFFSYIIAEVLFGGLVGFIIQVLFQMLTISGQMMSQQMGLAMASISDPLTGTEVRVVGVFCNLLGMLLFLAVDGHLVVLRGLHQSFLLWPPGAFLCPVLIRNVTVEALSRAFFLAFQMAAPILLMAFTINLSMALLARLVPQINILIMGFTLRVGVGLIGMAIFTPLIVHYLSGFFDLVYEFIVLMISG